jgi:hypothetical protein
LTASTSIAATVEQRTRIGATVLAVLLLVVLPAAARASAAPAASGDRALQVSFDPQAQVRLRGQRFVGAPQARVDAANDVVARHPGVRVERVFRAPEAQLDADRARLQRAGRRDVPDLNRHYRIVAADAAERDSLVQAMAGVAVVDEARADPQPTPPPATGNYVALQRYGAAAPAGIDAGALAQFPGGRGELTKIVDVEYSWNRAHEDLARAAAPDALIPNGTAKDPFQDTNHGTAVLGALIATDNGFGVTGLAPGSPIGMVNAVESSPCNCWALAQAIYLAAQNTTPGDVILVEQQVQGSGEAGDYVAAEYWAPVYDAISFATKAGVIVVEAAGNGLTTAGVNLDAPWYGSPFPQGKPDSGAIVAGAGTGQCSSPANARFARSAFGARVNLQGWGQCVTTAGYGGLFDGGPNARYTDSFSGTSSASAIVAGAAALYSSVYQATHDGQAPTPTSVRDRLIATGTPQANPGDGHIGPLPNLAAAASDFPPIVTITAGPAGPTTDPAPTFAFTANEAGVSFTCRLDDAAGFTPCSSPLTLPAQAAGPHALRVRATDTDGNTGPVTVRAFSVEQLPAPPPAPAPSDPAPVPPPDFGFTGSGDPIAPPPVVAPRAPGIGPGTTMTVRVAATGAVRLARPTITCPASGQACSVAVTIRRAGAGNAILGKATLSVQPGRTATIRFTLTRAARALLKRKGTLKATARITARQASLASTRTLRLTLKRR